MQKEMKKVKSLTRTRIEQMTIRYYDCQWKVSLHNISIAKEPTQSMPLYETGVEPNDCMRS